MCTGPRRSQTPAGARCSSPLFVACVLLCALALCVRSLDLFALSLLPLLDPLFPAASQLALASSTASPFASTVTCAS